MLDAGHSNDPFHRDAKTHYGRISGINRLGLPSYARRHQTQKCGLVHIVLEVRPPHRPSRSPCGIEADAPVNSRAPFAGLKGAPALWREMDKL
jgi:hypothetical protein